MHTPKFTFYVSNTQSKYSAFKDEIKTECCKFVIKKR